MRHICRLLQWQEEEEEEEEAEAEEEEKEEGLGLIGWDSGGGDEEVAMVTTPFLLKVMM